MRVDFHLLGIHLPEIGLWLDPGLAVPTAWISHGHSDHARAAHGLVFATDETLTVYGIRVGAAPEMRPMPAGQPWEYRGARLTAFPAGHILGSAQLLVEYQGERLVYTGDVKLRPPLCGTPAQSVPCDRLIVESTFGLPIFRFLDCDEARRRIAAFAQECLGDGVTPVFLGYPLGRGQELVHALCQEKIPVAVDGSIARFLPLYESNGYACTGWQSYEADGTSGKALVVTPAFRNVLEARGGSFRVAYVSGWAALDNARSRAGADELIPYSDHADFGELLELVTHSGARRVDVVHGYTEAFARILRGRGVEAHTAASAAPEQEAEN